MVHKLSVSGNDNIEIEKLFGPLDFCDLRITPQIKDCKWIIEKKVHHESEPTYEWVTVAEVEGQ